MRFFAIFYILNMHVVFANVARYRRSQIDDFLKNVFADNTAPETADAVQPTDNQKSSFLETDQLIDACREVYEDEYCFQTIFGSNYF